MRTRLITIIAVLLLALIGPGLSASADPGPATLKFEGSSSSHLIWDFGSSLFLPVTPYVSNSGTPLVSKLYITIHDAANYNYWARIGFCYGNGAYEAIYPNSHCDAYYNPAGAGAWIPFVELNNQNGNQIVGTANGATSGNGIIGLSISYTSGDQYTIFWAGTSPFEIQTFFSRDGFMPVNAGGYAAVANANPANGDTVWIGGLGQTDAALFNDNELCSSATGQPSQDCAESYWYSGYPTTTNPNICPGTCPYADHVATDTDNRYFFAFWTKPY